MTHDELHRAWTHQPGWRVIHKYRWAMRVVGAICLIAGWILR